MPGTIGFIGLGIMGRPMAHNVLKAGFPLVVQNRHQAVTEEFLAAGARASAQPRDIAASCDVVITMLPDSPEVIGIVAGLRRLRVFRVRRGLVGRLISGEIFGLNLRLRFSDFVFQLDGIQSRVE